ncbi:peroxiredoxin Q/BCP [Methylobacillus rhizosphaerae]|uniref:thioredoxin-dependent peroxiredoxin n=1 Tax=Methylobacillus rhizosphaerae TaxID=551994 RepID=A0A238YSJ5_9PROT|nr:peroxiredoxin [Methylobacillus rhizosphaerae]SNR74000.1 peroxiredoxin Q/BCP [Methylobacillus rhizosphaerae]
MLKILSLIAILGLVALAVFRSAYAAPVPKPGTPAPDFILPDAKKEQHRLSDYADQWLVLYFYPKDDTPGCTKEACSFRDDLHQLEKLGAKVVGISVDDSDSHAKFAEKYSLPFPLLADADGKVADRYGALTNLGLIKIAKRYTFLIDPKGNIAKTYLSVDTSRHSQEIIDDLKQLKAQP